MVKFSRRMLSRFVAFLIGIVVVIVFGIQFAVDDDGDDSSGEPKKSPSIRFLVFTWNHLPIPVKMFFSKCNETLYESDFSRHFINPYVKINYAKNYLQEFKPPQGKARFETFQNFFMREYRQLPQVTAKAVWPCEGLLCDKADFTEARTTHIKGEEKQIRVVFGSEGMQIPEGYEFINIFLHNRDYHHIHAVVSGRISHIETVHGDLIFLRPWLYKNNPTLPAMINERVIMKITSTEGTPWWLSIVGGPAVGSVELPKHIAVGSHVKVGEMIASFRLGSTCCLAIPPEFRVTKNTDDQVKIFSTI